MKDDRVYLLHIRDALGRIADYTAPGRAAFLNDPRTQDAVVRNLEIVGEAAKRVSEKTRNLAPDVPWRAVSGMRDKLIHDYFGVNLEIVWQVVEREGPALRRHVDSILDRL
ncbi:MAG: HepT-like ribonuclease domain-containing protein [Gemmatimonadales bacterium]